MSREFTKWALWLIGMTAIAGVVSGCTGQASHDPNAFNYPMGME